MQQFKIPLLLQSRQFWWSLLRWWFTTS